MNCGIAWCFTQVKQQWAMLVLEWVTEFEARYGMYPT